MKRTVLAMLSLCLLTAGATMLGLFAARHPDGLPARVIVLTFYPMPLAIAFAAVGAAIGRRRPDHPVGWLLALVGAVIPAGLFAEGYAAWELPGLAWVLWAWTLTEGPLLAGIAAALLLFPTGTPPTPAWRWLGRALAVYAGTSAAVRAVAPWPRRDEFMVLNVMEQRGWPSGQPIGWEGPQWINGVAGWIAPIGAVLLATAVVSLGPRWRRSAGDERQQVKWLALAGIVVALELLLGVLQPLLRVGADGPSADLIGNAFFTLIVALLPVAIGLAIVRYRLYDIDVLISRTLVFGGMAAFITAAYLVAVVVGGDLIGRWAGSATLLALAATAGVALTFETIRTGLQAVADRVVFGERAVPYELVARFGRELSAAVAPSEVLATIAETAARAVRARAARVTAILGDGGTLAASWPAVAAAFDLAVPVRDRHRVVGEILVATGGTRAADAALLRDIAAVAGGAIRNVRLNAELRTLQEDIDQQSLEVVASRERLVAAAEAERQRLAHLISARIGPDLDALRTTLAAVGPLPTDAEIRALGEQAAHLVTEVRAVSRGILPALLADHGLAAALRASLRRLDVGATLDIDPSLVDIRLPAPMETTVYLACQDLVTAAAHAGVVNVRLWLDGGDLAFSVSHDPTPSTEPAEVTPQGAGIPLTATDRLAALGGELRHAADAGTVTVTGRLPVGASS